MHTVKIQIGAIEETYAVVFTNAPVVYEYEYCIPLVETYDPTETLKKNDGKGRLVLIPLERLEYQRGRYSSGLYFSTVLEDAPLISDRNYVAKLLFARMRRVSDADHAVY
jgi:hypothetical protein